MSSNVIPRAFGACLMDTSNACSDFFTKRMSKVENKKVDESVHRAHASLLHPEHPRYRRMENSIVSKVSLRTSQTRKYNRIYVMIKVWGSLGSIKSIHLVTVSTPLTSNAPSVVSVTVLSRLEEQKTLTVMFIPRST